MGDMGDMGDEEPMGDVEPGATVADLEEWRGKNDTKIAVGSKQSSGPDAGYKKAATTRGHAGFGDAKKESLQEIKRMQKLANLIK